MEYNEQIASLENAFGTVWEKNPKILLVTGTIWMIIDYYLNYSTSTGTWLGLQGSIVRPDGLDDGQLLQDSQQNTCKYKGKKILAALCKQTTMCF